MHPDLIFVPLLIQVLLTLVIYIRLGQAKEQAVKIGQVDQTRRALYEDAWPEDVRKINNNIRNQFETPVLFYVLVISLWLLDAAGPAAQLLACGYAVLRIAHAFVHTGSNVVRVRKRLFQASIILLFLLSGLLAVSIVKGII